MSFQSWHCAIDPATGKPKYGPDRYGRTCWHASRTSRVIERLYPVSAVITLAYAWFTLR